MDATEAAYHNGFDAAKAASDEALEILRERVASLEKERDEADRRAGAAERRMADYVDYRIKSTQWTDEAKRAAGYHVNVSFDEVWAEALAALIEKRGAKPLR